MLDICLVASLLFSAIMIAGMCWQKDIFVKLLFLNTGAGVATLFICFLGTYQANRSYIDIACIYFLLSVVGNSAYLKYFLQTHK